MKTLADESLNKINLVGKLLDATFDTGKTQAGAPYERARLTVRVTQTYGGKEETSEIPVSMFDSVYQEGRNQSCVQEHSGSKGNADGTGRWI